MLQMILFLILEQNVPLDHLWDVTTSHPLCIKEMFNFKFSIVLITFSVLTSYIILLCFCQLSYFSFAVFITPPWK